MHDKVWGEISYPFPNFNDASVISTRILLSLWFPIHAGIKDTLCYPEYQQNFVLLCHSKIKKLCIHYRLCKWMHIYGIFNDLSNSYYQ